MWCQGISERSRPPCVGIHFNERQITMPVRKVTLIPWNGTYIAVILLTDVKVLSSWRRAKSIGQCAISVSWAGSSIISGSLLTKTSTVSLLPPRLLPRWQLSISVIFTPVYFLFGSVYVNFLLPVFYSLISSPRFFISMFVIAFPFFPTYFAFLFTFPSYF